MNQGHKLLIEDDKLVLLNFAAARQPQVGREQALGLDPVDQEPLLRETLAHLPFRVPQLNLFQNMAALVGHPDRVLGHESD